MNRSARLPPTSPATARPQNASNWCCPKPASAVDRRRLARANAAVARHYRVLTPVAWRMQMPNNRAKRGAGARPRRTGVIGISLEGRQVIVAMCVGQLGSLLPHVVVPSILAAFLNSEASILTPVVVSVLFSVLAMPASILGNEFALRIVRHRAITAVMLSSAVVALLIGIFADASPML